MKKLIILISMFLLVFCGFGAKTSFSNLARLLNATEFSIYSNSAINSKDIKVTNAGVFYINTIGVENISKCINSSCKKLGESFVIKCASESKIFKLQNLTKYKEVNEEKIGDVKIIYAYTNMLKNYTIVNNQKVNLQIAYDGTNLTVGYPLILGSY